MISEKPKTLFEWY